MPVDGMLLCSGQYGVRCELGAVVRKNYFRFSAPFYGHRQFAGHSPARDGGVRNRRQTFAGDVVDNVQNAEPPAAGELIMLEVQ